MIAVFTKYDQFKLNIEMTLEDEEHHEATCLNDEVECVFHQEYLARLEGSLPFVCLESEDFVNQLAFIILIAVS
jgi:hypothetical protein